MGFAGFSIFFLLTGVVAIQLIQLQPVPVDAVSFTFILWNFSVRVTFLRICNVLFLPLHLIFGGC